MPASREMRRRRRRLWLPVAILLTLVVGAGALASTPVDPPAPPAQSVPPPPPAGDQPANGPPPPPAIAWRHSHAEGLPFAGRLVKGVQLPEQGPDWFTWDPALKRSPNRPWRRWGTDRLVRTLVRVLQAYHAAHPTAPRVGIGDLSRRHGGSFDERFGGLGHASHQNGLDVDVYYPRQDGLERRPYRPDQVDRVLAQDLVDRFTAAGAQYTFVGPRVGLHGRRGVVEELVHHDDHVHVRIKPR
jgi:Penicillin-insensitive murein endopeptidase